MLYKTFTKKHIIIASFTLVFFALGGLATQQDRQRKDIDPLVMRGLNYIYTNQLPTGELPSSLCSEKTPSECIEGNNVFITASAVYSLIEINKILKDKKLEKVINDALTFLDKQKTKDDLWRFWNSGYEDELNPDLDDTSITSFLVKKYLHKKLNNFSYFEQNKLKDGSYLTWVPDNQGKNEVDISVNTNIILYFNLINKDTSKLCNYLNEIIKNNKEYQELYTWNINVVYYNYSKAYQSGVRCLAESKDNIIQKVVDSQKLNGSVDNSVLSTSMAVLTLMNFEDSGNLFIEPAIDYLKRKVLDDHFRGDFYFFATSRNKEYLVKSDIFSTILSLEAILKADTFPAGK